VKGVDRKIRRAIEKSGGTPTTSSSPKQESFDLFEQLFGFVGTVAGLFLDYIVVTESDVRVHWVALLGIPLGLTALGWSFGRLFDGAINMWRRTSMSPPPWDPT